MGSREVSADMEGPKEEHWLDILLVGCFDRSRDEDDTTVRFEASE